MPLDHSMVSELRIRSAKCWASASLCRVMFAIVPSSRFKMFPLLRGACACICKDAKSADIGCGLSQLLEIQDSTKHILRQFVDVGSLSRSYNYTAQSHTQLNIRALMITLRLGVDYFNPKPYIPIAYNPITQNPITLKPITSYNSKPSNAPQHEA